MACEQCEELCVRYPIRWPSELRRAIDVASHYLADNTIAEVVPEQPPMSVRFKGLSKAAAWNDFVVYHFVCLHCDERFSLLAETYHGSGGYWEPRDLSAIRKHSADRFRNCNLPCDTANCSSTHAVADIGASSGTRKTDLVGCLGSDSDH
jgi:hypothetical protein